MKQPAGGSWLDPRVAAGAAIAALALWWAFRDVPFRELWRALAGADLWLAVLPSVACHWASLWVRALRWQQLAAAVGELPLAPAYRATAVRFMANNLFPLRLGELAGAWVVSREVGGSAAAWFGT
ncbi:MAG TPA: lysylphosphatidylglycerol synthase domain-containing protein, partial [Myxococcota bacterium]|nr:lysylphosphatidylglycerol synthase domain-containing protein [Myxococcota bacterium]